MQAERLVLSVSALNAEVSTLLHQALPSMWVEGEISNLARPSSGHYYFSLKDSQAQLRCALFRPKALGLRLNLANGLKIQAFGKVGLYEPRGEYQFIVERVEAAGAGDLQRQFELLKQKLHAEGLFERERKQALPRYPKQIGIISSATGAALQDILQILKRRSPHIRVLVYPVTVQGETAPAQIIKALQQANREALCDVLIIARGGGSLEDLWAFNDENVARTIAASQLPIISGIGHEIDFTIADFVADQRAPTPSAAAELVSPDRAQLMQQIQQLQQRLQRQEQQSLYQASSQLNRLQQRLNRQHPQQRLQQKIQRLDELELRLNRSLQRHQERAQLRLNVLIQRLTWLNPQQTIQLQQQQLAQWQTRLQQAMTAGLAQRQQTLNWQAARLHALSPLATLERGYALVLDKNGQLISRARHVEPEQTISVRLADGELSCRVEQQLYKEATTRH